MQQENRMKKKNTTILLTVLAPLTAFAAGEGVPAYYQKDSGPNANQVGYNKYKEQGYTNYVGNSGQKQVVASRTYSYTVPNQQAALPKNTSTMTTNGVAIPVEQERATTIYARYNRRFADFQFETGVNSILEWDDMWFNEITAGVSHTFSLGKFDLGVMGEYTYGTLSSGGLSMDYDLKPYDASDPANGIFTISMGDQSGKTHHIKFGLSAHHAWDIAGWKFSPHIGYEIFKHNLQMSDHYYPNPGVYIPLLTDTGTYVFGDADNNYYSVPYNMTDTAINDNGWYQVCMSPEDIALVGGGNPTGIEQLPGLSWTGYKETMGTIPWGVGPGDCVIIGGDGPIIVPGTTHIYETTWSGFYVGLEIEKQMTLNDKLRFYAQFGLPKYSAKGTWPNRTDWQQDPSFLDEGSNGAYSYAMELEYTLRLSDRLQLAIKADTNYFRVGNIGGELYVAEYRDWAYNDDGSIKTDVNGNPYIVETPAYTEYVSDSLKNAVWRSFGLSLGLKFSF